MMMGVGVGVEQEEIGITNCLILRRLREPGQAEPSGTTPNEANKSLITKSQIKITIVPTPVTREAREVVVCN